MRMYYLPFRSLSSLLVAFAILTLQLQGQQPGTQSFRFMNTTLPIDQRVDDLVGRMTLEEKVSQMRDHSPAIERLGFLNTIGGTKVFTVSPLPVMLLTFPRSSAW